MRASALSGRMRYRDLVSLLEVPVLNETYWSKVPSVLVDAIVMDMEDSAPQASKDIVREKVGRALCEPAYFGGRKMVVRVNNLATPWGRADLEMVRAHEADAMVCYPKAESADEVEQVAQILREGGRSPDIWVMIESSKGLTQLDALARVDGVVGLHFGYTDFAAEMAVCAYDADGSAPSPLIVHAAQRISVAAAANGLFSTGGTMVPDYRDPAKVEAFAGFWAQVGFTACFALSPSHVPIVHRVFSPGADEAAEARAACRAFEQATAAGLANARFGERIVTLPDYRRMQARLARCREA